MREQFFQFVKTPDRESYFAIRDYIIQCDEYDPYSDEFQTAGELYEQGQLEEAQDALRKTMPNLMLSPRAHNMLGFLHHKLGNDEAAQLELVIEDACLTGIRTSGEGTRDAPFIVTRTSDEHDLIHHMGKQLKLQSFNSQDESHFDLIECTDGSEYWFDITDAYNQLAKKWT